MPTSAEIKAEISAGPLAAEIAPFVAAGNDQKVADIINRQDIAGKKRAAMPDLVNYLSDQGILANIADAAIDAANPGHAAARKVVATLRLSTELGVTNINMERAGNQALISNLVSVGLMTVAQANGVKALANTVLSRAEILWGQPITANDVARAVRNDDGSSKI